MAYHDVRDSKGRLLFRFDPEADVVEVRQRRHGRQETVIVPLGVYRPKSTQFIISYDTNATTFPLPKGTTIQS